MDSASTSPIAPVYHLRKFSILRTTFSVSGLTLTPRLRPKAMVELAELRMYLGEEH